MGNCMGSQAAKEPATETTQVAPPDVKMESTSATEFFNEALVFIKPHAANDTVTKLVKSFLEEKHVEVLSQGVINGSDIDSKGIIDNHYSHIAKMAMKTNASDLNLTQEKKDEFEAKFGNGDWDSLVEDGKILNLAQYKEQSGLSFNEIEAQWAKSTTFKLAPGTYVGYLEDPATFIINAFYGVMRQVYTDPKAKVVFFTVRFAETKLSWKDFRGKVIGATDPSKAVAGSLRAKIFSDYESLGLNDQPNMGQNGVHASAGPVEGLRERMVWLNRKIEQDSFGKAVLAAGIPEKVLNTLLENQTVTIKGETGNAFDLLEDVNSTTAIQMINQSKL